MSERKTLSAAIKSRSAYETVSKHVAEGDFTEQALVVWKHIGEYYDRDLSSQSVDPEILSNEICRGLSSPKHKEAFRGLVSDLGSADASPANIVHDFLAVKREAVGSRLATALASGKSGKDVDDLLEEYQKWNEADSFTDQKEESSVITGLSIAKLTETYSEGELIRLWPSSLNKRLDGGLLRGHHVVVFARPEMGKTMFLVNAVAGFLTQGLRVLYVGNEDPLQDIVLRVVCRLTKRDKFTVLSDPEGAEETARTRGYDNLILAGLAPGTPREIAALVEEWMPDVLLIDQLRNLSVGGKDANNTQRLEAAATAARNIAKRYSVLVVSVTQAGDSASGKAVLDMGDVDSSNTGIPAQADVMVGIGASQEDEQMGRRVLSLPKNKRGGNHDFWPVRIDPQCSRIIDLGGE